MTQFSSKEVQFGPRPSSPMDQSPMDQSSADQFSEPVAFADHLRPFVLNYPRPEERSGKEASFLVTLFSGGDGDGWAFLLRPSEEEPRASARSSHGANRRWGLTVDAGRVVDVTPAGEDGAFCVVPLPSARATEPDPRTAPSL